jgi:hypothetical protein
MHVFRGDELGAQGEITVQTRSSIPLLVRACMHVPEHVAARPVQEQRGTLLSTEPPLWSDQMKRGLAVGPLSIVHSPSRLKDKVGTRSAIEQPKGYVAGADVPPQGPPSTTQAPACEAGPGTTLLFPHMAIHPDVRRQGVVPLQSSPEVFTSMARMSAIRVLLGSTNPDQAYSRTTPSST